MDFDLLLDYFTITKKSYKHPIIYLLFVNIFIISFLPILLIVFVYTVLFKYTVVFSLVFSGLGKASYPLILFVYALFILLSIYIVFKLLYLPKLELVNKNFYAENIEYYYDEDIELAIRLIYIVLNAISIAFAMPTFFIILKILTALLSYGTQAPALA